MKQKTLTIDDWTKLVETVRYPKRAFQKENNRLLKESKDILNRLKNNKEIKDISNIVADAKLINSILSQDEQTLTL